MTQSDVFSINASRSFHGHVSVVERLEFGQQTPGMCCGRGRASSKQVRVSSMGSGNGRRRWDKPVLLVLLNFFNHLPILEYVV